MNCLFAHYKNVLLINGYYSKYHGAKVIAAYDFYHYLYDRFIKK